MSIDTVFLACWVVSICAGISLTLWLALMFGLISL